jgi:hypothetical protein
MDNGLELTSDGYLLRPKRSAYRLAAFVGLFQLALGVFIVSMVASTSKTSNLLLAAIVGLVFAGFAAVGWFTSLPPTLTVTKDTVSVVGGAHRRRVGRSHVTGVSRGFARGGGRDKTYFIALDNDRRDVDLPVRHFDPAGLEEAMQRLGVLVGGSFTW